MEGISSGPMQSEAVKKASILERMERNEKEADDLIRRLDSIGDKLSTLPPIRNNAISSKSQADEIGPITLRVNRWESQISNLRWLVNHLEQTV